MNERYPREVKKKAEQEDVRNSEQESGPLMKEKQGNYNYRKKRDTNDS